MNGKSWIRAASMVFPAVLILAGVAWASPGDLAGTTSAELQAAIGGSCELIACHYTPACANTDDGGIKGVASTYFHYKSGSAQVTETFFQGSVGDCKVHMHYSYVNCPPAYYVGDQLGKLDYWFDICD